MGFRCIAEAKRLGKFVREFLFVEPRFDFLGNHVVSGGVYRPYSVCAPQFGQVAVLLIGRSPIQRAGQSRRCCSLPRRRAGGP
jgi:hypothetical protein